MNAPRAVPLKNGKNAKANRSVRPARPSRAEAEEAVRTLIRWAGDDPAREGLLGTPDRVVPERGRTVGLGDARDLVGGLPHAQPIARLHEGDFFGEMSLMTGERRRATVRATRDSEMLVVDGSIADRRLTALSRRGDRVAACLTVNQPRALIRHRKLLASNASWDAALAAPRDLVFTADRTLR